jgi:hypothetical protein
MDQTALIDLVMGQLSAAEDGQLILDQARRDKYALKSRLFADEAPWPERTPHSSLADTSLGNRYVRGCRGP